MSKVYFGISRSKGTKTIVGVVANNAPLARPATQDEVRAILEVIRPAATESLIGALLDNTYPNKIVVWDKRADARSEIAMLRGYASSHFDFAVGEVGEVERNVKPVLGWRILLDGDPSAYNYPCKGDTERVLVDHASQFGGDTDANYLFKTREAGRKQLDNPEIRGLTGYKLVPVYA